ncbi:IML1 [Sanghuangporus sanghuang]
MSSSRSQSQNASPYRRKRSNTIQSVLRSPILEPLAVGSSTELTLWVHDSKTASADVIFNPEYWPGIAEGDYVRVTEVNGNDDDGSWEKDGFLFKVKRSPEDAHFSNALQISVSKSIADAFGLRNHSTVNLTRVDSSKMHAEYIEIMFQDQYLGRSDMWRLGQQLHGQCVYLGQEINFVGSPAGKIQSIYINGRKVSTGLITSLTKCIYRSLSAKITIFIQVCRELWEFAGDGERYTEKVVHSFLPALFRRWREADTNHIVTIVLISRVYYLATEVDYAAGPLRKDDDGRWYKDFFKVITDLEILQEWKPTLVSLKESFVAFQRDILLTHHYHRATLMGAYGSDFINPSEVKLVGRISFAHEGPILEALNLALNPMETHYVDRSLSVTGAAIILITPGTGYYQVSKRLLRLTTLRLLDQGVGVDVVSLTKHPLHQSPIFSFKGYEPDTRTERGQIDEKSQWGEKSKNGWKSNDPLWGGDDEAAELASREKSTFWWEPFWISISFWDEQMDQPFRQDRFIARARMHQIEMLGLLEHDVLSSIQIPFLPDSLSPTKPPSDANADDYYEALRLEAGRFDLERFTLRKSPPIHLGRDSAPSSGATMITESSFRSHPLDKRPSYVVHRASSILPRVAPIEESPRRIFLELPPEGEERDEMETTTVLSTSPPSSIRTNKSEETRQPEVEDGEKGSGNRTSISSKITSSWLFNPLRNFTSRQTQSVSSSTTAVSHSTATVGPSLSREHVQPARSSVSTAVSLPQARTPRPVAIRNTPTRSILGQQSEEALSTSSRSNTFVRHSGLGVSPRSREDPIYFQRRSTINSLNMSIAASSPIVRINPLRPSAAVPTAQRSLASRWQHMFPQPLYKHQIKWKSMVTPGCLPLTTEHFPSRSELENSQSYEMFSYDFVVHPPEMKSFLVKKPTSGRETVDEARRAYALVVMRGMASLRLVQGFQFIVRPRDAEKEDRKKDFEIRYFSLDDNCTPKPTGASQIFQESIEPVFLSTNNEIHRISYNGESIQVRRYVRRMPPSGSFDYKCLVWPKDGVGYTELSTMFGANGLENYGWNRLDMLIAGYEHQFSDSLRYWRTRFIVIPTLEAPPPTLGASGEKLNDEETRLLGSDKLAEMWSKLRWISPQEREKGVTYPPLRFLPTYLSPTASALDEHLVSLLEEIMASGPLQKKMKSEREITDMSLASIAKLMREDCSLQIKDHRWHTKLYEDSFTGYDFASWLCREFRDVSTREQAQEWGMKLLEQGLFEHCRGKHGFLDGHYFYRLKSEYSVPRTPRSARGWTFRSVARHVSTEEKDGRPSGYYPGGASRSGISNKKNHKRLVLSQTMVVDVDPNKKSDQAESVILHYDLIHNPANVFHFELHWLGTTARLIEEQLRAWSAKIERHGLKLVEAYVTQICDIRERNPFQSCFPLRLALPPPVVPDMEKRLQSSAAESSTPAQYFFEYALLRHFNFILDIEAKELYPDNVDVFYSYRRSAFTHSQFVHRSGVAFIQVLGGTEGFLFLINRLMSTGRAGPNLKNRGIRPVDAAEELRLQMLEFCQDREKLSAFYDKVLETLATVPEEPPPLSI